MGIPEIKRLLELPVDERLRLSELLRASVRWDGEIRWVPEEAPEVQLVKSCLAALEQGREAAETSQVVEA